MYWCSGRVLTLDPIASEVGSRRDTTAKSAIRTASSENQAQLLSAARAVSQELPGWLKKTFYWAVNESHLHSYLEEFCFRFDRAFKTDFWKELL